MDLHTQLSKNMEQIVALFESRMEQFDKALTQSQPQTSKSSAGNLETLIADYTVFKELMWKSLSMLRQQLLLLSTGFDNHEMLSRRKVLLIHGLPEDKGDIYQQVNDTLCNQMKLDNLDNSCVDICHRLGVKGHKLRPVVVRFSCMKFKNIVWNAKTTLKGTGITISEFLTKHRQEVFVAARKHFGMKNCWTSDGTIIIALPDKTRKKVITSLELQHVIRTYPQLDQASQDFRSTRSRRVNKNSELNMLDPSNQGMTYTMAIRRNISLFTLETPAVREALINQNFDAVVSEWFVGDFNAGYAAIQQVPWILLSGVVMQSYLEHTIDMVRSTSTHPSLLHDFPLPMSFWQRLCNTGSYLFMAGLKLIDYPTNKAIYESQFSSIAFARGVVLPPFINALHNISILLVNSHPSFAPAMSLPPNVVDIAGYHIDENIPALPKDLQELLDSSSTGFVYFSMGSILKSSALPEKTRKSLIKSFSEISCTVLWKFEETIEGLSKNVHVRPWMPQSSILSHPNIKVFITHGGLLSTLESLHYGVPIIAVPVFGDQPGNAKRSVREGRALMVDLNEHLGEELGKTLKEMLSNDSYYNRAKYLSKLFRNRPVKPEKLIQHYVELAIESKGAYHLRSKTHDYAWYELWMLDQLAFVLAIIFITARILKKTACLFTQREKQKKEMKKKKH